MFPKGISKRDLPGSMEKKQSTRPRTTSKDTGDPKRAITAKGFLKSIPSAVAETRDAMTHRDRFGTRVRNWADFATRSISMRDGRNRAHDKLEKSRSPIRAGRLFLQRNRRYSPYGKIGYGGRRCLQIQVLYENLDVSRETFAAMTKYNDAGEAGSASLALLLTPPASVAPRPQAGLRGRRPAPQAS